MAYSFIPARHRINRAAKCYSCCLRDVMNEGWRHGVFGWDTPQLLLPSQPRPSLSEHSCFSLCSCCSRLVAVGNWNNFVFACPENSRHSSRAIRRERERERDWPSSSQRLTLFLLMSVVELVLKVSVSSIFPLNTQGENKDANRDSCISLLKR